MLFVNDFRKWFRKSSLIDHHLYFHLWKSLKPALTAPHFLHLAGCMGLVGSENTKAQVCRHRVDHATPFTFLNFKKQLSLYAQHFFNVPSSSFLSGTHSIRCRGYFWTRLLKSRLAQLLVIWIYLCCWVKSPLVPQSLE